ncbi:MAG: TadE/TadG family type IV pilus assembly protein [Comamonas sp.]
MKHLAQRGATIIEFALGFLIFLMLFLGLVDFSRLLYTWAAANEAARAGARYAVVCDDTTQKTTVLTYMQARLPQINDIDIAWSPSGCTTATCQGATVTITDLKFQWIAPLVGKGLQAAIPMPKFSTYLPREAMRKDPNSATACAS